MKQQEETYTLDELVGETREPDHISFVGIDTAHCGHDLTGWDGYKFGTPSPTGNAMCGRCLKLSQEYAKSR